MSTAAGIWKKWVEGWEGERAELQGIRGTNRREPQHAGRMAVEAEAAVARDQGGENAAAGELGFVEVTEQLVTALAKEAGVIELEVGGATARLRGHVDAEALAKVLTVLEGRR